MAQNNQPVGRGALFKNDKQGIEKRPDYTDTASILGKEFFVSAWIQESKNGVKYLGLAYKEKTGGQSTGGQTPAEQSSTTGSSASTEEIDDSIPF